MNEPDSSEPSSRIRVVMALGPTRLAQVITHIQQQSDIRIVGIVQDPIELLILTKTGADVLVLEAVQSTPLPSICTHLLSEFPDLRIVVVPTEGDTLMMYWLGLHQQQLRQSPSSLSDVVRQVYGLDPIAGS